VAGPAAPECCGNLSLCFAECCGSPSLRSAVVVVRSIFLEETCWMVLARHFAGGVSGEPGRCGRARRSSSCRSSHNRGTGG